ncbi:MAG: SH3 domain-containing protein [Clostridiales bacterium]|nr:SH3 domain-containing protein [Clostridiales bacterium]
MTRNLRRIATFCMVGSLALFSGTKTAYAAGQPVAGITVLLNNVIINPDITKAEIDDIIDPIIKYGDLAIANVRNYVNIRSKADTNSRVVGKLYNNSVATIISNDSEIAQNSQWIKIKSGNVTGYINSDYLFTGSEVYNRVEKVKSKIATVKAKILNVRSKASTNSSVVTQIPKGFELEVIEELNNWAKISFGGKTGYVSKDYVHIRTDFKEAISVEEEQKIIKLEKDIKKKKSNSANNSLRQRIVNYALKFEGNPYVWGGTSLTRGADCSGYVQSVLKKFGIYIPRTSRAQANSGRRVSMDKIQPGDLIFYRKNGVVNHVAMYIGNGKVIGAASRKEGIKIKRYNYRTPYKVVSFINN